MQLGEYDKAHNSLRLSKADVDAQGSMLMPKIISVHSLKFTGIVLLLKLNIKSQRFAEVPSQIQNLFEQYVVVI